MSEKKHLIYIPSTLKDIREHMTPADFVSTESIRKYVRDRMQRVVFQHPHRRGLRHGELYRRKRDSS